MKEPVLIKTHDAEGAINKHRIVTFGTNAKQVERGIGNTDPLIGVNEAITVDDDERVDVIRSGFAEVEYGGAITKEISLPPISSESQSLRMLCSKRAPAGFSWYC
jgi:hypothetical protein